MDITYSARMIGQAFRRHGFSAQSIREALGPGAWAALHRGEPGAVRFALRPLTDRADFAALISAFLLRDPLPAAALDDLVGAEISGELVAEGAASQEAGALRLLIDARPHRIADKDVVVISDADASMTAHVPDADHVLGVGAASLSLGQATSRSPVGSVLDLGTGSGVHLLAQHGVADAITGTDVHPRALDFARATLAANDIPVGSGVELLEGSWFEPVAGRHFDRIVANPPFVVGKP